MQNEKLVSSHHRGSPLKGLEEALQGSWTNEMPQLEHLDSPASPRLGNARKEGLPVFCELPHGSTHPLLGEQSDPIRGNLQCLPDALLHFKCSNPLRKRGVESHHWDPVPDDIQSDVLCVHVTPNVGWDIILESPHNPPAQSSRV